MKLKALFITRNYPPKLGGLEVYSFNLIREFETHDITYKIVSAKSNIHLAWFLPYCFFKALYITWKHGIRSIHLCDGLLAPIGVLLKILTGARVSVSIHGLDITYRKPLYQRVIPRCVARMDKIVCVSRAAQNECLHRGIPSHKCTVIPNGIRPDELYLSQPEGNLRRKLQKLTGASLENRIVLVSVGHLVRRKGVAWFVEHVMPRLAESYQYLIIGDGPEYRSIKAILSRHNLHKRVFMFGKASDDERNLVYNASDIFVMPNITVPGDLEGFGIAAIEAGSCGLPVIASNIQGLRDAVLDGQTGYLVEERDIEGYLAKIKEMNLNKENVRSIVNARFDWAQIYKRYYEVFVKLQSG